MKKIFLFLILSLFTAAWVNSQTITFKNPVNKKQDSFQQDQKYTFDLSMTLAVEEQNQTFNFSSISEENKKEKILNVADNQVTKKEITFVKKLEISKQNTEESTKESPVSGKTYILESLEAGVSITYPDGTEPSQEEKDYLIENENFDDDEDYANSLEGKSYKVGSRITDFEEAFSKSFGSSFKDGQFIKNEIVLIGTRDIKGRKYGVFKMEMQIEADMSEGISMIINASGEVLVNIDNPNIVTFNLSGPIELNLSSDEIPVTGGGTFSIEIDRQ